METYFESIIREWHRVMKKFQQLGGGGGAVVIGSLKINSEIRKLNPFPI